MPAYDEIVEIEVGDKHIAGTLVRPAHRLPGVLFVHGWGGSQAQYLTRARGIAALGCLCLTFDLSGHAATQRQFATVSREINLRDVMAAYDLLARHPAVDPAAIALVGSSYGGYLASILTSLRPVRWLALRVPALYQDTGWQVPKLQLHKDDSLRNYRRSHIDPAGNRALQACAAFKGDVLLVESEFDDLIPHPVIAAYVETCAKAHSLTYRVMKGADHGLTDERSQRAYTELLMGWLGEMMFGKREPLPPPPVLAEAPEPERSTP